MHGSARRAATSLDEACLLPTHRATVPCFRPPQHLHSYSWRYLFSVVGLVALRQAAPRSAAQRTTSIPPAGRGRVRRSATNATTLNTYSWRCMRDPARTEPFLT